MTAGEMRRLRIEIQLNVLRLEVLDQVLDDIEEEYKEGYEEFVKTGEPSASFSKTQTIIRGIVDDIVRLSNENEENGRLLDDNP